MLFDGNIHFIPHNQSHYFFFLYFSQAQHTLRSWLRVKGKGAVDVFVRINKYQSCQYITSCKVDLLRGVSIETSHMKQITINHTMFEDECDV